MAVSMGPSKNLQQARGIYYEEESHAAVHSKPGIGESTLDFYWNRGYVNGYIGV